MEKPVYLKRTLDLKPLLQKKSFFLLGPRATGKTRLIAQQFKDQATVVNLLRSDVFLRLSSEPWALESIVAASDNRLIVIDEIQKIPALLDEVHRLIEEHGWTFLLTGSSARKLKKQQVNLLAGRAWEANLFPLCSAEIPDFNLQRYLRYGGLPSVYLSEFPAEELIAYVDTYLREEIQTEALTRKIQAFSRFLQISALTSGRLLNFSSLSNDTAIPASTIREYYQILQDTLLGFLLPAWTKSRKRKAISTAKFYYFDIGVKNQLAGIHALEPKSDLYGQAFEHFIAMELRAYISYQRLHLPLQYWQAKNGQEVDFIIGDDIAIEVKTTNRVTGKHLKGLKALQEENLCKKYILVSFDSIAKATDGIEQMPWQLFLQNLWNTKIV